MVEFIEELGGVETIELVLKGIEVNFDAENLSVSLSSSVDLVLLIKSLQRLRCTTTSFTSRKSTLRRELPLVLYKSGANS